MDLKKHLIELSDVTHGRISRREVFTDFIVFGALTMSTRTDPVHREKCLEQLEDLKKWYKEPELQVFQQGLQTVSEEVVKNSQNHYFRDLLAVPFQEFHASNRALKQDFTPESVGRLLSEITIQPDSELPEDGFFTLSDHACGSGVLLLAAAERMSERGFNPSAHMVVQAADLDIRCVHMAYLQLSLYGIPAVVIRGDTITLEEYDRWYTPVYLMNKWIWRAPMPFGNGGYESDEMLKMLDEPVYRAARLLLGLSGASTAANSVELSNTD